MSYPQPPSDGSVTAGQDFFRLQTRLISPGDIYESVSTAYAFALGPECDVSRVNVAYFDSAQVPTFMNFATISPSRLMTGRLTASLGDKYSPAGLPGRLLIWSEDFFDQNFVPHMVDGGGVATEVDFVEIVQPVLDVIQYFSPQQSLPPARNDKTYTFQELRLETAPAAGGSIAYIFPYYGRKYASIEVANCSADTINVAINGVNYVYTDDVTGPQHTETVLTTTTNLLHAVAGDGSIIPSTSGLKRVITAAADGMFDALVVMVAFDSAVAANSHNVPLKVVVSDSPR
jgi:hypothetical protein